MTSSPVSLFSRMLKQEKTMINSTRPPMNKIKEVLALPKKDKDYGAQGK